MRTRQELHPARVLTIGYPSFDINLVYYDQTPPALHEALLNWPLSSNKRICTAHRHSYSSVTTRTPLLMH